MAYMTYCGPAHVVFELGEERSVVPDLVVSMEQTHTATFRLVFIPDLPETGDEWGLPSRGQP